MCVKRREKVSTKCFLSFLLEIVERIKSVRKEKENQMSKKNK